MTPAEPNRLQNLGKKFRSNPGLTDRQRGNQRINAQLPADIAPQPALQSVQAEPLAGAYELPPPSEPSSEVPMSFRETRYYRERRNSREFHAERRGVIGFCRS